MRREQDPLGRGRHEPELCSAVFEACRRERRESFDARCLPEKRGGLGACAGGEGEVSQRRRVTRHSSSLQGSVEVVDVETLAVSGFSRSARKG